MYIGYTFLSLYVCIYYIYTQTLQTLFVYIDQTLPPPPPPPLGCGDPGTPRNGIKIGNSYNVGSVVSYECNSGYELVGSSTIICSFDGFWTGSVPSCVTSGGM